MATTLAAVLGGGRQAETNAFLNRMGSFVVSIPTINAIDAKIRALKAANIWQRLDCYYEFQVDNSTVAKFNWVQNAYNATAVNSPAFSAFRGFTGDGATSYLDTNFNPTTAVNARYTQNSAFVMVNSRTNVTNGNYWDIGQNNAGDTSGINSRSSTGPNLRVRPGPNGDPGAATFTGDGTSLGMFWQSRIASTGGTVGQNANLVGTHSFASTAMLNADFLVCAAIPASSLYSARQLSAAALGGGLTNAQITELFRIRRVYQASIGVL